MSDESQNKSKDWSQVANQADNERHDDSNVSEQSAGEESRAHDALEHPSYKALEDKLTQTEQKMHENWDKAMRAVAELDNVRRRSERDIENAHKYGLEKFLTELLPVVDSLEQGLQTATDEPIEAITTMRQGIELTLKLMLDVLSKFNVEQINPEGELFDPQKHEAMSMQDAPDAEPGTVLVVFQKGYLLHGRVMRPARVIVAKGQPKAIDEKA